MEIKRCERNHFYSAELYSACPFCAEEASGWFLRSSILRGCSQPEYLASGSSGAVYRVRRDGKNYALKVIDCASSWNKFNCAQNEIALMQKLLSCRNVVPLVDSEVLELPGGRIVLLLEPLMTTFEEYYKSHRMTVSDVLQLGIDICTALDDCWRAGVAHLDVQPKNLFVDNNGHFCLGDFSVAVSAALLEQEPQLRGTLSYMAPEVYESRRYSQASDIYSLGMVLYCLLNHGNLPFMGTGSKEQAVMTRLVEKVPVPPLHLNNMLDELLAQALAVDARQRYDCFRSMQLALTDAQRSMENLGKDPPAAPKASRPGLFSRLLNLKQPKTPESSPTASAPPEKSPAGTLFDSDSFSRPLSLDTYMTAPLGSGISDLPASMDFSPIDSTLCGSDDFACTLHPFCPSTEPMDSCFPSCSSAERFSGALFDSDPFACTCAPSPMDFAPIGSSSPSVPFPKPTGGTMFDSDTFATSCVMDTPCRSAAPRMSQVQFSAITPKEARKEDYSIIQLFMYEQAFRSAVEEAIAMADAPVQEKRSGFQKVRENTRIKIVLTCPDMQIDDNVQEQVWCGGYLQFDFAICPPAEYKKRQILLTAAVYFDDVPATRLMLTLKALASYEEEIELARQDIITAFVSYASQDRTRVGALIQGMRKARPDMDIFFDITTLRSGENWENTLYREILRRDILFLCWSQNAMASDWVEKEWRYALEHKGLDAIEPIPLEPPDVCPPPRELWSKHFNDSLLYIINR